MQADAKATARRAGMFLCTAALLCGASCILLPPGGNWDDSVSWKPSATRPIHVADAKIPLTLSVEEAILLTLENNRALEVQRLNPPIRRTFEEQQRGVFDPILSANAAWTRARNGLNAIAEGLDAGLSLSQFFPAGSSLALELDAARDLSPGAATPRAAVRGGLTATQPILRGRGRDVNLADIRQAQIDTNISRYELRGFAEALVARVERTYWDCVLAQRQIEIVSESLKLAEQAQKETTERINVGTLPGVELAAAQAEVAVRNEDLINAQSDLAATRLRLLQLLNPAGAGMWDRDVTLSDLPVAPEPTLGPIEPAVTQALRLRPEMNQARLALQRGDLELVKTRNGLLPKLDLFVTLGRTGYANSFIGAAGDIAQDGYDVTAGARFEFPLGNHAAKARHERATLDRKQAGLALDNLSQLVELDVRSARIEVERTREQIAATAATLTAQQEALRAESEKFAVGRTTSFLRAQAQRNLVASQISHVRAIVNHLKALVDLRVAEGRLLADRGIKAPGDQPATDILSTLP